MARDSMASGSMTRASAACGSPNWSSARSSNTAGGLTVKFFPRMPQRFGSATPEQPVSFTTNAAAAAGSSGGFTFTVREATLFGIGLENLTVKSDGDDTWSIDAEAVIPAPVPVSSVAAQFGIKDGDFAFGGGEATFAEPGLPLGNPIILLQKVRVRVEVDAGEDTKCVPRVGEHTYRFDELRAYFVSIGWTPQQAYEFMPDLRVDYGFPDFALCGGVTLTAGPRSSALRS